MKVSYKDYFKNRMGSTFTDKDISRYQRWNYAPYRFLKKKITLLPEHNILEIGSGEGGFFGLLDADLTLKDNYIGLELDQDALSFAKEFYGRDCFLNVPFEKYETKKRFDLIFAFEVLEHLQDPLGAIGKIRTLLKPGGRFCGTSPYPFPKNIIDDATHLYVLHPRNWEMLFLDSGYSSVELYPMSFLPLIWRIDKRLNPIIPVYLRLKYIVSTCLIIAEPQSPKVTL